MADNTSGNWETARIVNSEEDAALVVGFLNSNGIDAEVESLHASEFPTDVGRLSEVRIKVPADRLQEAVLLLEQSDNDADAAVADEGEPETR
ncbi:MAG TPA: hypothetical protein VF756_20625 [Thermoanaerobaculia bacterium]